MPVEITRLGPMALVHKDGKVPLPGIRGESPLQFRDIAGDVAFFFLLILAAEFVDEGTYQLRGRRVERGDQVRTATGAVDVLVDPFEHLLDLFNSCGR